MTSARICLVLMTGLGDVVLGLPLVEALKRDLAARRITWVVKPMSAPILRHHLAIDEVIVYRQRILGAAGLWRDLRGHRFDVTLTPHIYLHGVLPTVLSRGRARVGFGRPPSRDGMWLTLTHRVTPRRGQHLLDDFFQLLEPLGVSRPDRPEWGITFVEEERESQRAFLAALDGRPLATIVPASGRAPKDWAAERWARVAEALDRDFGFRVVLVGGPDERATAIARAIVAGASPAPHCAMGGDLRKAAWILDASRLVLAPDTGLGHIACALGVPLVGLYGHTNPWRWGPYRKFEDLWIDAYTDPGSRPDPDERAGKEGRMERIMVSNVLERVERALTRYPRA